MDIAAEILIHQILKQQKNYFFAASDETVTIGEDADNPSFITDLHLIKNRGFEIDSIDGKIKNISGRLINYMSGTVSFQPEKDAASTTLLYIWGERSLDGVTWTQNIGSLRSLEIPGSGETFKTSISIIRDFHPNEYMRFRVYAVGAGGLTLVPPSITSDGKTISGHSVLWELQEP